MTDQDPLVTARAAAWEEGEIAGFALAMRRQTEPTAPRSANPYLRPTCDACPMPNGKASDLVPGVTAATAPPMSGDTVPTTPTQLFQVIDTNRTWHAARHGLGVLCGVARDTRVDTVRWEAGIHHVRCTSCTSALSRLVVGAV